MTRLSKYNGGSKLTTFRLPIEGHKSTRVRVQALLDEIASESQYKRQIAVKSTGASAKTTLDNNVVRDKISNVMYNCGCSNDGSLFRRAFGCRIARVDHR